MKIIHLERERNLVAVTKLISLWGLAESGLGGVMFAFKIPFTGFFIGAVAIILLSLIAKFSNNSYREIISATIIVMMVKAAVSPNSPLPAYLAVLFQGVTAAVLFSTVRSHKLACIILGMLSMAESSLQKIIVLTIIFGKNFWEAINNLIKEIANTFSLNNAHDYTLYIIVVYVGFYVVWGAIVGVFAGGVPSRILNLKPIILKRYSILRSEELKIFPITNKRSWGRHALFYTGILLFIIAVFIFSGADNKMVASIILRSVASFLVLILIARPLLTFLFKRWLVKRSHAEQERLQEVLRILPVLKKLLTDAFAMSKSENGFFKRLKNFVTNVIILTLYAEVENRHRHF